MFKLNWNPKCNLYSSLFFFMHISTVKTGWFSTFWSLCLSHSTCWVFHTKGMSIQHSLFLPLGEICEYQIYTYGTLSCFISKKFSYIDNFWLETSPRPRPGYGVKIFFSSSNFAFKAWQIVSYLQPIKMTFEIRFQHESVPWQS